MPLAEHCHEHGNPFRSNHGDQMLQAQRSLEALNAQYQQALQRDQLNAKTIQELQEKINELHKLIEEIKNPFDQILLNSAVVGDADKVDASILLGANIEATNAEGQTPLFLAIKNNHQDVVQVLLDLNANVDVTDKNGTSIFDLVCTQINDQKLAPELCITLKEALDKSRDATKNKLAAIKSVPSDHLVAYYPFKGNAQDESHHGNDGIVYVAKLTTDRFGNENSAYYFDGNSCISGKAHDFPKEDRTVSVWFKPDIYNVSPIADRGGVLFGYSGITGNFNQINGDPNTDLIFVINRMFYPDRPNHFEAYAWGTPIGIVAYENMYGTPSVWNHLVLTSSNAEGLTVYLNGKKIGNNDQQHFQSNEPINEFAIGSWILFNMRGNSESFKGSIDEVRVYDRALNSDEIKHLYEEPSKDSVEFLSKKVEKITEAMRLLDAAALTNNDIEKSLPNKNNSFYKSQSSFFNQMNEVRKEWATKTHYETRIQGPLK